ncbi:MAG: pyrimidine utilization protein C [Betaproteobacteria bacterium]|nr:pyrimidine utilization protein C [Betaproteobacteria bacterium]
MPFMPLIPKGSAPPLAPYSPGSRAGDTIYVSGTLALDQNGALVGKDDARAQTRHILESIRSVLEAGGASLSDIAYNMIFIKRREDYAALNEVYKEFFPGTPPARYCIICELVKPEFLVEIASIAHCSK